MTRQSILTLSLGALLGLFTTIHAADWPSFRGPEGQGVSEDKNIPTEWSETKNLEWKLDLPGKGFSSPIIVGDSVYVTGYEEEGALKRTVSRINRKTGKVTWTKKLEAKNTRAGRGGGRAFHGYASHTPVSDGESLYVFCGPDGVVAFDLDGKQLWQESVGTGSLSMFGTSSSPILYKDMLIVPAGCESGALYALDKKTGKQKWKAEAGSLRSCYSTPNIVKNPEGEDELVISVPNEIWGMNPENGKLKWYAATDVDSAACTTLVENEGILYAVGGRNGGRTAVKIGGKDDITKANVVWSRRGGTYVPSPVYHAGHVYYADRSGIIRCIDAKTGEEKGTARTRGDYYASLTLIDGKLYAVSRGEGIYVLEANPNLKQISHNTLGNGDYSASPAISDGQLFIRSDSTLYCIGKK